MLEDDRSLGVVLVPVPPDIYAMVEAADLYIHFAGKAGISANVPKVNTFQDDKASGTPFDIMPHMWRFLLCNVSL